MSAISQERLLQVLLAPQISEKATYIADKNEQVVFKVATDATKPEVKAAVEALFKVEVKSVQVLNVKGKAKRFGRSMGRRKDWKKAYVSLAEGQEIERLEHDADIGKARHRNEAVEAIGGDRHAELFGTFQAVARGIDADKGAHFEHIRQPHDLDHQVGADIARSDNRHFRLRHHSMPCR